MRNRKVYLIGGLMANDNYGDVIQAKVWVDFYSKKGLDISFVHYPEGEPAVIRNFTKVERIELQLFLKQILNKSLTPNSIIHMYGGGYMTKDFGRDFLVVLKAVIKTNILLLITGVQIDQYFAEKAQQIIANSHSSIRWISVRDSLSKKCLQGLEPIICDDSFGYFKSRVFNKWIYSKTQIRKSKILLQLSLNGYMYKKSIDKEVIINKYRDIFTAFLKMGRNVEIVSSFDKDVHTVEESGRMIDQMSLDIDFKPVSTNDIDNFILACNGYSLALVNSFHTYLLCKFKLNCPVYIINLSDYYDQKTSALHEYGLLKSENQICNLEDFNRIFDDKQVVDNTDSAFRKMFKRFDEVLTEVSKYLN